MLVEGRQLLDTLLENYVSLERSSIIGRSAKTPRLCARAKLAQRVTYDHIGSERQLQVSRGSTAPATNIDADSVEPHGIGHSKRSAVATKRIDDDPCVRLVE